MPASPARATPAGGTSAKTASAAGGPPSQPGSLPPITVIVGEEELLAERAIGSIVAAARAGQPGHGGGAPGDPAGGEPGGSKPAGGEPGGGEIHGAGEAPGVGAPDIHDVRAADLSPGEFSQLTAPSLFGDGCLVIVRSAQDASKEVAAELSHYAAAPAPEVVLVVTHAGGAKGKALLASLAGAGARRINAVPLKRFGERLDFLRSEFGRAGRKADDAGLRALLDAVGTDLRDLAAACSQLADDTTGVISQAVVTRYYRGRAEATGFTVADRAVEGKLADALEQLRWALATGTSPVLIVSALAQGVRGLGRVGSAARGKSAEALAAELGMPPWKIDRVRQQLRGWTPDGVARAHAAVAAADAQVKGEGASAGYALEVAIAAIVASRSGR
ncbi:MAG TPA: DNA polymerase III subunit delta [Streptosporangiaceae bacterium]|nr:DNA polymerase III subunit delta [Streptosporangiaceae bacterium]